MSNVPRSITRIMRSAGALMFVVSVPGCLVFPPIGVVCAIGGVSLFAMGRFLARDDSDDPPEG